MLSFPEIDPVALELGPLKIRWYGLMYLIGFACAWWLGRVRAQQDWRGWTREGFDDALFFMILGVIVGGRVGYILFYNFDHFLRDPLVLFQVWNGGMSFHGGLLGVLVAIAWIARKNGMHFFAVADFIAPLVPPGLLAGRLGNFINGNLWGRPTDVPWAMIFPDARAGGVPRHPSQLYEALLEGLLLFAILWFFSRIPRPMRATSGLFLVAYGLFRFSVEFFRDPVGQVGYVGVDWLTKGQLLCLPMMLAGGILLWLAYRKEHQVPA